MKKHAKKKVARRKRQLSGLGLPPEQHVKRSETYEFDAVRFLRDMENEVDSGRCPVAFNRLIDGVSYAGMAEAESQGAGKGDGHIGPLQSLVASSVRYYRKNCMGEK